MQFYKANYKNHSNTLDLQPSSFFTNRSLKNSELCILCSKDGVGFSKKGSEDGFRTNLADFFHPIKVRQPPGINNSMR